MLLKRRELIVLERGEFVVGLVVGFRSRGIRFSSIVCGIRGIFLYKRYMLCLIIKIFFFF